MLSKVVTNDVVLFVTWVCSFVCGLIVSTRCELFETLLVHAFVDLLNECWRNGAMIVLFMIAGIVNVYVCLSGFVSAHLSDNCVQSTLAVVISVALWASGGPGDGIHEVRRRRGGVCGTRFVVTSVVGGQTYLLALSIDVT